jgi:transposase
LVKLLRAGELRAIWVPDTVHEAVRDLTRAREVAMLDLKKKRQQVLSFLLRHGWIFPVAMRAAAEMCGSPSG